jgi:hypothetical protein
LSVPLSRVGISDRHTKLLYWIRRVCPFVSYGATFLRGIGYEYRFRKNLRRRRRTTQLFRGSLGISYESTLQGAISWLDGSGASRGYIFFPRVLVKENCRPRTIATGYLVLAGPCSGEGFSWCGSRTRKQYLAYAPDATEVDFTTYDDDAHWTLLTPRGVIDAYPLSHPSRLMRLLRPITSILRIVMSDIRHQFTVSNIVAA